MVMLKIDVGSTELKLLDEKMKTFGSRMNSKTATAVNKTARMVRDNMNKRITQKFNISLRNLKKKRIIFQSKKAKASDLSAQVRLKKTLKLGVQYFAPKHTGAGVTFALERGGSRKLISKAFMGSRAGKKAPKLNGGVFIREAGAKRLPINKLYALSPWGMFRAGKMQSPTTQFADKTLRLYVQKGLQELARTL
jgi:hypothetical protein